MLKQYVFTEEEVNKITSLVKEAHDVVWCDMPSKGDIQYVRLELLDKLSNALEILGGDS